MAYRVELFDEDIDSIRTFDPADQRSIDKVREVTITPCKEIIADSERLSRTADTVAVCWRRTERMSDRQAKLRLRDEIHREVEIARADVFPEIYKYISLLYPEKTNLYDYLPKDTILIMDEPARLLETAKQRMKRNGICI